MNDPGPTGDRRGLALLAGQCLLVLAACIGIRSVDLRAIRLRLERADTAISHAKAMTRMNRERAAAGKSPAIPAARERSLPGFGIRIPVDLNRYPEMVAYWAWIERRSIVNGYGAVIGNLHLPPETTKRLYKLLNELSASWSDARQAALASGIAYGSEDMSAAITHESQVLASEVRALIGDDLFQKLVDGERLQVSTRSVDSLQSALYVSGCPLNAEQTQAMALIQAQDWPDALESGSEKAVAQRAMMRLPVDPETGLKPYQRQDLDRAASFLSQAQLEGIRLYWIDLNRLGTLQQEAVAAVQKQGGPSK
jgi:hypothetical protein